MPVHRTLLQQSFTLHSQNLGGRVSSGAGFQFLGIALRTIITIGSTAILARLLTPADFGYVVMATVVTGLAALFSNFGFTNLLIHCGGGFCYSSQLLLKGRRLLPSWRHGRNQAASAGGSQAHTTMI